MDSPFLVHVESLRNGHTLSIEEKADAALFDVKEEGLTLTGDVGVSGEVYFAQDDLVFHLKAKASALIPCSICNAPVAVEVETPFFTHVVPLEEIRRDKTMRGGSFNYGGIVREEILLNCPAFAECNGGKCPERKTVAKYLKDEKHGVNPFANLDKLI